MPKRAGFTVLTGSCDTLRRGDPHSARQGGSPACQKFRADTLVREIFTLEISRISKSYSVTGWRIGYAVANPELSIEGARKFRNAHVPDLLDCPDAIPAYAHLIRSEGRRAHKASRAPSLASTPVDYLASLARGRCTSNAGYCSSSP